MAIVGYKLRINGGSLVNEIVDVGLVLSDTTSGLDADTEYTYEIAKYNGDGLQTDWSPPESATTDGLPALSMVVDGAGNAVLDNTGNAITILL